MKVEVEVSGGNGKRKMEAHLSASAECIVCGKAFVAPCDIAMKYLYGDHDDIDIGFTCPHCNTPYKGEI